MLRKVLFVIASSGLLALLACSGDDESEKYPDATSFCAAKANEECTAQAALCGATVDACKTQLTNACTTEASAAGGGRVYTASKAEACITKTHDLFNQKTFTSDQEKDWNDVCERVFAGSKAANAPCANAYECQGDMVCDKGVCANEVVKKIGEGCSNAGETCEKGAYCGEQGQLKFCLAKNAENDICNDQAPCKEDLRCAGTCKPRMDIGQPCDFDSDCKEATTPPYCDTTTKKCAAKYTAGTQSCKQLGG
jgi:hypothetical protein